MSRDGTLDLAQFVLSHHRTNDGTSAPVVLMTVHDQLETEHALLAAMAEREGGVYLSCVADPDARTGAAPINPKMATHLTSLARNRGLEIEILEVDGRVVASVSDGSVATGSLLTVLGVMATLASSSIDRDLVVLSYPLEGLSVDRAALLWEANLSVETFPLDGARTFVAIAGGPLDVEAHCGRVEGSVRAVVRGGEFTLRKSEQSLSDSIRALLDRKTRPVVFFLGAGTSASSHIPQGNRYRDYALEHLTSGPDREQAFRRWLTDHNRWLPGEMEMGPAAFDRQLTLERVLREEFFSLSGRPRAESRTVKRITEDCTKALDRLPEGRKALRELVALLPHSVVLTVNFDELVETDLGSPFLRFTNATDYGAAGEAVAARLANSDAPLPILKLHGTIGDPDSLVANIDETSRGLKSAVTATLDSMIATVDGPLTWIWIGCSMRDIDVNMWSQGRSGLTDLQEWWVDPVPPQTVADYAVKRRRDWAILDQELSDRQITATADRFLMALLERAKTL